MKYFVGKLIIVLILTFPISGSLGAAVTYIDRQEFEDGGSTVINGVVFNNDGSKMFISFQATTGNIECSGFNSCSNSASGMTASNSITCDGGTSCYTMSKRHEVQLYFAVKRRGL